VKRLSVNLPHPAGGLFSHFAHFISDFLLPLYSILRNEHLLDVLIQGETITVELQDLFANRLGPMIPILREVFPGIDLAYVPQFTLPPVHVRRGRWQNNSDDLDHFALYLRQALSIKSSMTGVIIVKRGLNHQAYPGGSHALCSGADRRLISAGFDNLVSQVMQKRKDTKWVVLEQMTFSQQVSLFLNADTLIGQHGAAFVHAHWMPKNSHLIELQCQGNYLSPQMVHLIAKLRGHSHSITAYPGRKRGFVLEMDINNPSAVSNLITPKEPLSNTPATTEP
jgi:hypothetical protein